MAEIVDLSREDAPDASGRHRIVITFENDHEINGMKVEINDVTPEQCAVAAFYIERSANQVADVRQIKAAQEAQQIASLRADPNLRSRRT